jgi:chemotaxis regulatin CheY-phosphate phosphatase CheZ
MTAPRKVFRIEETVTARIARTSASAQDPQHHTEIMQALTALRGAMKAVPSPAGKAEATPRGENQWLDIEAEHLTRIAHELAAVTTGTEQATQKILAAAEEIDQLANNLSAAFKGTLEQGLAQDISDHIVRIFEACNFQDLTGQRVTKVMATVRVIEDHVARALDRIKNTPRKAEDAPGLLHGPRLDIDSGHMPQKEIDAMFGG